MLKIKFPNAAFRDEGQSGWCTRLGATETNLQGEMCLSLKHIVNVFSTAGIDWHFLVATPQKMPEQTSEYFWKEVAEFWKGGLCQRWMDK